MHDDFVFAISANNRFARDPLRVIGARVEHGRVNRQTNPHLRIKRLLELNGFSVNAIRRQLRESRRVAKSCSRSRKQCARIWNLRGRGNRFIGGNTRGWSWRGNGRIKRCRHFDRIRSETINLNLRIHQRCLHATRSHDCFTKRKQRVTANKRRRMFNSFPARQSNRLIRRCRRGALCVLCWCRNIEAVHESRRRIDVEQPSTLGRWRAARKHGDGPHDSAIN